MSTRIQPRGSATQSGVDASTNTMTSPSARVCSSFTPTRVPRTDVNHSHVSGCGSAPGDHPGVPASASQQEDRPAADEGEAERQPDRDQSPRRGQQDDRRGEEEHPGPGPGEVAAVTGPDEDAVE